MSENTIELHVHCSALPVGLAADLGRAMAKLDSNSTFDGSDCDDRDCRFVFRAEVPE